MIKYTEIDTSVNIWDYYFKVRIPYLQSRTIEDIRKFGVTLSGVRAIDSSVDSEWITTMLPISDMIEHYREGVPIKIPSKSDIKLIYDFISEHIHAWKNKLEKGINIGDAPIDDLILMDKFANLIYDNAKYQFDTKAIDSILTQQMFNVQKINAANFFNVKAPSRSEEDGITRINAGPEEPPDRNSLADFFKNKMVTLRRY